MKLAPLLTGTLIIASTTVAAESYSANKFKNTVNSMDDNADKQVTFEEYFEDTVTDNSDSFDVNKDGYITAGEVALEIKEDLVETVDELRKHGVSERDTNATIISELNAVEKDSEAIINMMDSDGDELVEPEELKAYKRRQFSALDRNKDGVLSLSDLSEKSARTKKSQYKGYPIIGR